MPGTLRATSARAVSHSSCGSTASSATEATSGSTPLARSSWDNARLLNPRADCRELTQAAAKAASSTSPTSPNRSSTAAATSSGMSRAASRSASCLRLREAPVRAVRQICLAVCSGSSYSWAGSPSTRRGRPKDPARPRPDGREPLAAVGGRGAVPGGVRSVVRSPCRAGLLDLGIELDAPLPARLLRRGPAAGASAEGPRPLVPERRPTPRAAGPLRLDEPRPTPPRWPAHGGARHPGPGRLVDRGVPRVAIDSTSTTSAAAAGGAGRSSRSATSTTVGVSAGEPSAPNPAPASSATTSSVVGAPPRSAKSTTSGPAVTRRSSSRPKSTTSGDVPIGRPSSAGSPGPGAVTGLRSRPARRRPGRPAADRCRASP